MSNVEGEIKISDTERENRLEKNNDDNLLKCPPNEGSKNGINEEKNSVKDDQGDKMGSNKEHLSKGISIIDGDFPNDEREGWIDFDNKAIVYNNGHKFVKCVDRNKGLYNYNLLRVIISIIIINKNDHTQMDAVKTFEYFTKLFHKVWKK